MGAVDLRRSRLAVALVTVAVATSCSSDADDDTLSPLPIAGGTVAVVPTPSSGPTTPSGTAAGSLRPATAATAATTPSTADVPVGDWDGARFDVGTIEAVAALGAFTSIELDRWSYTGPDGRTVDAAGLAAEPVVAWWRTSPFSNVRVQARTFVLAPDVEVLTLDPAGRAAACADPPRANPPRPEWEASGTSALGTTAPGSIAVLTYGDTGLVTRVRVTRGC